MKQKIITQGAEAIIILDKSKNQIIKKRISKSYRIPFLDEKIRKLRTRNEGKNIERVSSVINTPKIIKIDEKNKEIIMEFIKGIKLSDDKTGLNTLNNKFEIAKEIGKEVAKMHDINIIHGDLTTSNMIYVDNNRIKKMKNPIKNISSQLISPKELDTLSLLSSQRSLTKSASEHNFKIFFIDFGLSIYSSKIEDRAVDIHLFKQALESKHFKFYNELLKSFLEGYKTSKNFNEVIQRLNKVELRGRYKH